MCGDMETRCACRGVPCFEKFFTRRSRTTMRRNLPRAAFAAALSIVAILPAHAMDNNIKSYVCEKLDDFTAVMGVVKADQRELAKISKDLGYTYKFSDVQMKYKEPNKIRIEGTIEGMKGLFILDG